MLLSSSAGKAAARGRLLFCFVKRSMNLPGTPIETMDPLEVPFKLGNDWWLYQHCTGTGSGFLQPPVRIFTRRSLNLRSPPDGPSRRGHRRRRLRKGKI